MLSHAQSILHQGLIFWYYIDMLFGFNWVDLAIIAIVLLFALEAYGGVLVIEVLDFFSFLIALLLSFRYYNYIGELFQSQFNFPHGLSLVIGFMLTWFLAEAVLYFLARLILNKLPHFSFPGEKIVSTIPGILKALIFLSLLLVLVATFPVQPKLKKDIQDSKLGPIILKNAYQLEKPVKEVFGGVTNDTLTFLTIKPKTNERVNLGFETKEYKVDSGTEEQMINLVNQERRSRGLKILE